MRGSLAVTAPRLRIQSNAPAPRVRWQESAPLRNRSARRGVVPGVGRSRALGAALVAVGVGLSGCASAGGEEEPTATTTSSASAEESGNPWDLPIEQRPALFDPCADVPADAVEQAVGAPIRLEELLTKSEPGQLQACGWSSDEVVLDLVATWKSHSDYLANPTGVVDGDGHPVGGRNALRLVDQENEPNTCRYLFFTGRGTVALTVSLATTFKTFRGHHFADACDVLQETATTLVEFLPPGDFR